MSEDRQQKPQTWEYHFLAAQGMINDDAVKSVNDRGEAGWELVSTISLPTSIGSILFVFKRPTFM